MEDRDQIDRDEIALMSEEEIEKELEMHKETFDNFSIRGDGMSGDSQHGFAHQL